jgi:mono/diheme cytochrome c family protein
MKSAMRRAALCGSAVAFISGAAFAQTNVDFGKRQYESSCAVCHGLSGKGDGPYRQFLTKPPSDLTILAKKNDGVLPVSRLYDVIDGRWEVLAHGPREMPVWGRGYYFEPAEPAIDPSTGEMERSVRVRILAVIDYINRLQVK